MAKYKQLLLSCPMLKATFVKYTFVHSFVFVLTLNSNFKHKNRKNETYKWLGLSTSLLLLTLNLSLFCGCHLSVICIKSKCKWLMSIGREQKQLSVLTLVFKKSVQKWCNPNPQGHWIEDSKKIGPEMQEKALGFSWALW